MTTLSNFCSRMHCERCFGHSSVKLQGQAWQSSDSSRIVVTRCPNPTQQSQSRRQRRLLDRRTGLRTALVIAPTVLTYVVFGTTNCAHQLVSCLASMIRFQTRIFEKHFDYSKTAARRKFGPTRATGNNPHFTSLSLSCQCHREDARVRAIDVNCD